MIRNGIDVSEHQGSIDWEKVKGKIDFAILRAGYGRYIEQKDSQFERNYSECKRLGIPCGAYWYSYAGSVEEAREEARICLQILKGKKFDYPVYFDVEEPKPLNSGKVNDIIVAFGKAIEEAGFFAGLYMSRSPLTTYVSKNVQGRFTLWIAEYNSKCNYSGDYGMWQKSSGGTIEGIKGYVDLNECYKDYPKIINKEPEKITKQVTLIIDDHKYSGLLTEDLI